MKFSHEATIPLRHDAVDLADWLFELTDGEYQACARGHRAAGVSGGFRRSGMVNVESIGGTLLIQHYVPKVAEMDHVTMVSTATRAYIMHVFPVSIGVVWDMQIKAAGADVSRFQCSIDIAFPLPIRILGYLVGAPQSIRRHLIEETGGFARDILRKYA